MRIPGLASGMDIDSMVKDMLVGEKDKVDKAKQEQQISKWKQEIYKDIIKDTKNLYDKYLSMTSPNNILNSNNYSTVGMVSSNSSVITATAGPGAQKVNYGFEITQMAQPPKLTGNVSDLKLNTGDEIRIKTGETTEKVITIGEGETIKSLCGKINKEFPDGSIKATYSEMTGEFTISGSKTGKGQTLDISGSFVDNNTEKLTLKEGQNLQGIVKDASGNEIKKLDESSNTFTIDNITYTVNGKSRQTGTDASGKPIYETTNMSGVTDTKKATENMAAFINDYNKLMDKAYGYITEKKVNGYPPLTEEQRKDMSEEEIKNWEGKSKKGILRNDSELRSFMNEIQNVIFGSLDSSGMSLKDMGISSHSDYNKKNQISFDPDKFAKVLEEKGDLVYKTLAGGVDGNKSIFDKLKDTVYKYSGSSTSIFATKAGMGGGTENNNTFSKEINKQESSIKELIKKMEEREKQLYSKFAALESSLNQYNSQMSYFMQSSGY